VNHIGRNIAEFEIPHLPGELSCDTHTVSSP
jgi:hypothetical protein